MDRNEAGKELFTRRDFFTNSFTQELRTALELSFPGICLRGGCSVALFILAAPFCKQCRNNRVKHGEIVIEMDYVYL